MQISWQSLLQHLRQPVTGFGELLVGQFVGAGLEGWRHGDVPMAGLRARRGEGDLAIHAAGHGDRRLWGAPAVEDEVLEVQEDSGIGQDSV